MKIIPLNQFIVVPSSTQNIKLSLLVSISFIIKNMNAEIQKKTEQTRKDNFRFSDCVTMMKIIINF